MTDGKLEGKYAIITGATNGIGVPTARSLALEGANLTLACRNLEAGIGIAQTLSEETGNKNVVAMHLDLASLDSVRAFADGYRSRNDSLHLLVNNAGMIAKRRTETADGFESTFGVNHLAPFLLTNLLLDLIRDSAPARIVNVASTVHYSGTINFDDLMALNRFKTMTAYSQSKLANVLFTRELARRLEGSGVTANCLHPGVVATNIIAGENRFLKGVMKVAELFLLSSDEGAETSLHLALSDEVADVSGLYFDECKEKAPSAEAQDDAVAERLWQVSEELTTSA